MYLIQEFSKRTGLSVRMLRHYDKIHLLPPEGHSPKGYRLYGQLSLDRIEQILLLKEMDFSLQEIRNLLTLPGFDRDQALQAQKKTVQLKMQRLEKILSRIDVLISHPNPTMSQKLSTTYSADAIVAHQQQYAQETKERWGQTDAYQESQLRYQSYSKEKLQEILAEHGQIYLELSKMMDRPVSNPDVQALVQQARDHITKYWYECKLEIFEGLGQMYVQDSRFTANIDKVAPGLAQYLSQAIAHYVDLELAK